MSNELPTIGDLWAYTNENIKNLKQVEIEYIKSYSIVKSLIASLSLSDSPKDSVTRKAIDDARQFLQRYEHERRKVQL